MTAALRHTERKRDAFRSVSDALLAAEDVYGATGEGEDRELLADAYALGSECLLDLEQTETALLYQNRAVKHLRALWEEDPSEERLSSVAKAHRAKIALHPEGSRQRDEHGRECLLWEEERAKSEEGRHAVAAGFLDLARSSSHMAEFLARARDIWRELASECPASRDYARYADKMEEILSEL